jgi:hypothetical protein
MKWLAVAWGRFSRWRQELVSLAEIMEATEKIDISWNIVPNSHATNSTIIASKKRSYYCCFLHHLGFALSLHWRAALKELV